MVTISIVINNYNYARFLREAIDSALHQTYQPVEVIVVDDGSTDSSAEVIKSYGDRVTSLFQPNNGQASAFNTGFRVAHGDVVLFLDSDDVLHPNAVERIVLQWNQHYSKIHWRLSVIDSCSASTGKLYPKLPLDSGDLRAQLLKKGSYTSAPTSGNAFSRSYLEQVMPIPEQSWRGYADCYLLFLAPLHGSIGVITEPLSSYRVHGKNMTNLIGAGGTVNLQTIEKELKRDAKQRQLLLDACKKAGERLEPGAVLDDCFHLKRRLASLKLQPRQHPFPDDTIMSLLAKILDSAWQETSFSTTKKLLFSCWAIAMATLPTKLSMAVATAGFQK